MLEVTKTLSDTSQGIRATFVLSTYAEPYFVLIDSMTDSSLATIQVSVKELTDLAKLVERVYSNKIKQGG